MQNAPEILLSELQKQLVYFEQANHLAKGKTHVLEKGVLNIINQIQASYIEELRVSQEELQISQEKLQVYDEKLQTTEEKVKYL
ncbi:MAG: hypothetical protein Q8J97_08630, partial [Flavobacteriaceae bacterium]|nr:hypothetical protein [Flavobacteriaceae bacterium]